LVYGYVLAGQADAGEHAEQGRHVLAQAGAGQVANDGIKLGLDGKHARL
jgi:hypothetical protein